MYTYGTASSSRIEDKSTEQQLRTRILVVLTKIGLNVPFSTFSTFILLNVDKEKRNFGAHLLP